MPTTATTQPKQTARTRRIYNEQDYSFFHKHAGYSYDPATETKEQGRRRCAKDLANAEALARNAGYVYRWQIDQETDSREFSDRRPYYALWCCICLSSDGGLVLASLFGIDFGRDGQPWGNPYKRVVEAELALEALTADKTL